MGSSHPIVFVGTPIGNLGDLSPRARTALEDAEVIFCEHPDTTQKLLHACSIPSKRLLLLDQHNESETVTRVIAESKRHRTAVVSRAGMPGINDPGTFLMRHLLANRIPCDVIPGPSIVICLMACSGSFGPFHYFGYFPKKEREVLHQLSLCSYTHGTALYLESPHRITNTLQWLSALALPDAGLVVLHEFTKYHQTVFGCPLSEIPLGGHPDLPLSPAKGEWAFSITFQKNAPPFGPLRMVDVDDLEKLLTRPYEGRIAKFAKKYGITTELKNTPK